MSFNGWGTYKLNTAFANLLYASSLRIMDEFVFHVPPDGVVHQFMSLLDVACRSPRSNQAQTFAWLQEARQEEACFHTLPWTPVHSRMALRKSAGLELRPVPRT